MEGLASGSVKAGWRQKAACRSIDLTVYDGSYFLSEDWAKSSAGSIMGRSVGSLWKEEKA